METARRAHRVCPELRRRKPGLKSLPASRDGGAPFQDVSSWFERYLMFKFRSGLLTAAMIVAALAPAFAQQSPTAPTEAASSAGAAARIQTPVNGDAVTSPFKVQIGPSPIPGVAAADKGTTGHHVLLIDTPLSDQTPTQSIKADTQHIPFRKGQIATMVSLPPGKHTLQFVRVDASDIPFKPPVQSDAITITVKDTAAAGTGGKEAADAKIAQETQKAAEVQQAAEAKRALEAKEALEAKRAREASEAEQALAAKEAREVKEALEARKASEAKQALETKLALETKEAFEAKLALEAKRALETRLAKEEEQSRLALAKQAREAQLANEARQPVDAKRPRAARTTTAQLRVKHAKARKARSAMAHLKTLQMPLLLHPELREIERPHRLHQRHHHHLAHAHTHGHHHAHGHARQLHHGQLHHHERHRHPCHSGPDHRPNKLSSK